MIDTMTVTMVVFRGTGTPHPEPLIQLGHVGIHFAGDHRIWGFHPHPSTLTPDLEQILKTHRHPVRGMVYDDTAVFVHAAALAAHGARTIVYQATHMLSIDTLGTAYMILLDQLHSEGRGLWYELPPRDLSQAMPPHVNNCVTWPRTLGLPILNANGSIRHTVEALAPHPSSRWTPPAWLDVT